MRGAEALGSENRGAQRGACARACVCRGVGEQRRGEGCRVGLRDPVAEMELPLLEGHGVIGWLRVRLDMPVRNLHAAPTPAPPSPAQPSALGRCS